MNLLLLILILVTLSYQRELICPDGKLLAHNGICVEPFTRSLKRNIHLKPVNVIDTPFVCPDGSFKAHTGNCEEEFRRFTIKPHPSGDNKITAKPSTQSTLRSTSVAPSRGKHN